LEREKTGHPRPDAEAKKITLSALYTRVTIRPGFPGFVPVLWGVSRCPDDLCKIAKLSRFFTCEEGKEIVNLDLRNVSTLSSHKHCPGLSIGYSLTLAV